MIRLISNFTKNQIYCEIYLNLPGKLVSWLHLHSLGKHIPEELLRWHLRLERHLGCCLFGENLNGREELFLRNYKTELNLSLHSSVLF